MNYVVELTIPANTAESAMVKEELRLPKGAITKVAIYFPWGCKNLAHVKIFEYEHQCWPTHLEKAYSGNEILIEFPEDYALPKEWNLFSLRGWNEDDTYSHTPIVYLTVLEEKVPAWARFLFGRLFGRGK